jgi:hypothetical protein
MLSIIDESNDSIDVLRGNTRAFLDCEIANGWGSGQEDDPRHVDESRDPSGDMKTTPFQQS